MPEDQEPNSDEPRWVGAVLELDGGTAKHEHVCHNVWGRLVSWWGDQQQKPALLENV